MSQRLDVELVGRGLADSRSKAQDMIRNTAVSVNGNIVSKPAYLVDKADEIHIVGETLKYVGKGGIKLEKAILDFNIDLKNKICVDFGASTGGFTDCMLKNGAVFVYAVDVGSNQLDCSLIGDSRVENIENTNIKYVSKQMFEKDIDFCTVDLSFISLSFAVPVVYNVLSDDGEAVMLIKPQFEAGRNSLTKRGIVKDRKVHIRVLENVLNIIKSTGFSILNLTFSPIKGGNGNIEYLVYIKKSEIQSAFNSDIKAIVDRGFECLSR